MVSVKSREKGRLDQDSQQERQKGTRGPRIKGGIVKLRQDWNRRKLVLGISGIQFVHLKHPPSDSILSGRIGEGIKDLEDRSTPGPKGADRLQEE